MNVALLSVNLSRARRGSFAKCVGMSERFLLNQLKKRKSGVFSVKTCRNACRNKGKNVLTKKSAFRQKNSLLEQSFYI